jgi:hypothetical protein
MSAIHSLGQAQHVFRTFVTTSLRQRLSMRRLLFMRAEIHSRAKAGAQRILLMLKSPRRKLGLEALVQRETCIVQISVAWLVKTLRPRLKDKNVSLIVCDFLQPFRALAEKFFSKDMTTFVLTHVQELAEPAAMLDVWLDLFHNRPKMRDVQFQTRRFKGKKYARQYK